MPLTITKAENRVKPVTLYDRAQVLWITLADRAANWTPWSRKADTESDELSALLAALSRFRKAQLKLIKAQRGETDTSELEAAEKFNPEQPRGPAGSPDGGKFVPKSGSLNFTKRAEEAVKAAQTDIETQFNTFADSFAQKLGMTHDKTGENGWDSDELQWADAYNRSYTNDKALGGTATESISLALHANETIDMSYSAQANGEHYAEQSIDRSYKPHKLDKANDAIENSRQRFLKEHKKELTDALSSSSLSLVERKPIIERLRTVQGAIRNKGNAEKFDNSGGGNKMAGEYIQAILCPVDLDPERLKQIIGEHQSALLETATAEKHDNVTKYTLMPEDQFESLNVSPLADGVKVMHGPLKEGQAEKWGVDEAIMFPPPSPPTLGDLIYRKLDALREGIIGTIELNKDSESRAAAIGGLIDGFAQWLTDAVTEAEANAAAAIKTETQKRPSAWERFKGALAGATESSIANKSDTNKGGETMEDEKIKVIVEETAKATVAEMVSVAEKAEAEAATTKTEQEQATKAEERIKSLEDQVAALLKEKEEAAKKAETGIEDKAKELEALKTRMEALEAEKAELAKKMELFETAGGSPSKGEDNARKNDEPYKGKSFDSQFRK